MIPSAGDIHVYLEGQKRTGRVNPAYFEPPIVDVERLAEIVRLKFEAGGVIEIHTSKPWLWIEPERH